MKRCGLVITGLILILLLSVSCSSTPDQTESPEQTDGMAGTGLFVAPPEEELKNAENLKKAIDEYGLSAALPDEYQKGNDELSAGKAAMGSDNAGAKTLLDSAASRYQAVFDAGVEERFRTRQKEIDTAKAQADTLRASRAAAAEYAQGEARTGEFHSLFGEKKYAEALAASGEAIAAYNKSFETAKAKRDAAGSELKKTEAVQKNTDIRIEEVTKEIGGEAQ
jgi:hypothetical protein